MKSLLKLNKNNKQDVKAIVNLLPKKMCNFHGVSIGDGAILFTLLEYIENKKIIVDGDINIYHDNEHVIKLYKDIQNDFTYFYLTYEKIFESYKNLPDTGKVLRNPKTKNELFECKENFFNSLRNLIIYHPDLIYQKLNESAFFYIIVNSLKNGLYDAYGNFEIAEFNFNTKNFLNLKELEKISKLIKNVKFHLYDIKNLKLHNIKENDCLFINLYDGINENCNKAIIDILNNNIKTIIGNMPKFDISENDDYKKYKYVNNKDTNDITIMNY